MKLWSLMLFVALAANGASVQPPVSSVAIGLYDKDEKAQLVPGFINSVNDYLHRYEPILVTRDTDHVKMRVDYDFLYDVELTIHGDDYEIKVTLAQKTSSLGKARKQAAHLSSGVFRSMERSLMRQKRIRDR